MTRMRQDERGASAVEFALTLPFLLAILLGIMEFGWIFFTDLQITNAVRDGARFGAVRPPNDVIPDAQQRAREVLDHAGSGLESGKADVSAECIPGDDPSQDRVVVHIDYNYEPLTPLAALPIIPQVIIPAQLKATATMHVDTGEGCRGGGG